MNVRGERPPSRPILDNPAPALRAGAIRNANMKVVLFCGGFGMRMREYSEAVPKPMVPIGYHPILWHVMKYYAHYGHKDFILCLGYKADVIKKYFLEYDECVTNDFVITNGGRNVKLLNSDIHDWTITFVDTGLTSNIGQRLKAVEKHLQGGNVPCQLYRWACGRAAARGYRILQEQREYSLLCECKASRASI
jgi:Nucleotidyl transferase